MPAGRPTDYDPSCCETVTNYCLMGATNEELAKFLGICTTTLTNWMNEHSEFLAAIKNGREIADSNVGKRLYQRAIGYEHDDIDIRVCDKEIVQTPIRKYYPPDSVAAMFWLKNRRRNEWKDRSEVGISPIEPIILQDEDGNKIAELGFRKKPDVGND